MLEYRLTKFQENQQRFLEQIRQTIVEATTLSKDNQLIHELTMLGITSSKYPFVILNALIQMRQ